MDGSPPQDTAVASSLVRWFDRAFAALLPILVVAAVDVDVATSTNAVAPTKIWPRMITAVNLQNQTNNKTLLI